MERNRVILAVLAMLVVLALQGCGSSGSGSSTFGPTGSVDVSLTDGPGDYDHAYITVREIWFHRDAEAGPGMGGWLRYPLAAPVTVDLLTLSKGVVGSPIWKDIKLPAGTYKQVRVLLAATEDACTGSAEDLGLQFNNEVVIGSSEYPLRVPVARMGIMLSGEFQINPAGKLKLAIDFDAGHDIVEIQRNGSTEYILKPKLVHFDLDDAGAITGEIASAASLSTGRFVIKAEQVDARNPQVRVVRRWTVVDPGNGRFVLYPLRPGTYDIVIRGLGHETVIVRNVPASKGSTPASGATIIPQIMLTTGTDYAVDGSIAFPTGAWVDFYQTLQDDPIAYEVRFRHFNPMNGKFPAFKLSAGQVHVAEFVSNGVISGPTATTPVEGTGSFRAAAGAILYTHATYTADGSDIITSAVSTVSFGSLSPRTPPSVTSGNAISGTITMPAGTAASDLDRGLLFVAHGGMIVHALSIDTQVQAGSPAAYSISGLPGGSATNPLLLAFYGVDAIAWSSGSSAKAIAVPSIADLRFQDAAGADLNMFMLP